jgi:hypothetical protein
MIPVAIIAGSSKKLRKSIMKFTELLFMPIILPFFPFQAIFFEKNSFSGKNLIIR